MTVAELINELNKVVNKSIPVMYEYKGGWFPVKSVIVDNDAFADEQDGLDEPDYYAIIIGAK